MTQFAASNGPAAERIEMLKQMLGIPTQGQGGNTQTAVVDRSLPVDVSVWGRDSQQQIGLEIWQTMMVRVNTGFRPLPNQNGTSRNSRRSNIDPQKNYTQAPQAPTGATDNLPAVEGEVEEAAA